MAALQCELCGGMLENRDGMLVCASCGEHYDEHRIWELSMKMQNAPATLAQLRAQAKKPEQMVCLYYGSFLFLRSNGTVVAVPEKKSGGIPDVINWTGISSIAASQNHIAGLRFDGTVVAAGQRAFGECNVSHWEKIVSLAVEDKITLGVTLDGTVVTTDKVLAAKVAGWTDVRRVALYKNYVVGLRRDRTVLVVDRSGSRLSADTSIWKGIVDVREQKRTLIGLQRNGTLVAAGVQSSAWTIKKASKWKEIIAIAASASDLVGLRDDGTLAIDGVSQDLRAIYGWTDIVALCLHKRCAAGLKKDGIIQIAGNKSLFTRDWFQWIYHKENHDIIAMACGGLIGIRADGTIACPAYKIPDTVKLFDSIETLDYERQAAAIRWCAASREQ